MHVFDEWSTQSFPQLKEALTTKFLNEGIVTPTATWQGTSVKPGSEMTPIELRHVVLEFGMPETAELAQQRFQPNMPWAEEHFQERISGKPFNPPPSHKIWPHGQSDNKEFRGDDDRFSHTYPERFWPKHAGYVDPTDYSDEGWQEIAKYAEPRCGIWYDYGDLGDVVNQLKKDPFTRQAYLPVWFPEDTGAMHDQRVPCTLGYHFMYREGALDITYHIRSCDFRRHFADDVYLAVRLAQYVSKHISLTLQERYGQRAKLGRLIMHIGSFHIFQGDVELMKMERARRNRDHERRFEDNRGLSSHALYNALS